jgi:glycosyltransferase involved in cell wall biosynthesis
VGGVQEVVRQLAERLATAGIDVTVATSPHPDRTLDTIRNGVRVVSFGITGNWVRGMHGQVEEYKHFLLQGNFDTVMIKAAQQWTFDAIIEILPTLKCRKLFIPCGFSGLHNSLYSEYFKKMPQWLRWFDGLIFYAHDYQDIAFAKAHGLSNLYFVPNGVDEREFQDLNPGDIRQQLGIDSEHDLLMSVGSRIKNKGHWEVVQAFKKAKLCRPAVLVINANEPGKIFSEKIKRTIKHLIQGRLPLPCLAWWCNLTQKRKRLLIVDLSRADVVNLYKAANLFISASHVEYSPLVLFESAASGTPFISSDAGNSQEIADWTGAGVVLPKVRKNSSEVSVVRLVHELENMLSDRERLRNMGESARTSIWSKGFTWDQIVQHYQKLLVSS